MLSARATLRGIETDFAPMPADFRDLQWMATREGHARGCPIGFGETEREAIESLEAKERAREEAEAVS